jgi:hypothetical protein
MPVSKKAAKKFAARQNVSEEQSKLARSVAENVMLSLILARCEKLVPKKAQYETVFDFVNSVCNDLEVQKDLVSWYSTVAGSELLRADEYKNRIARLEEKIAEQDNEIYILQSEVDDLEDQINGHGSKPRRLRTERGSD